jgi:tetratricopeptide (TPR) repeat protein
MGASDMKALFYVLLLAAVLLAGPTVASADDAKAEKIARLIKRADELWAKRYSDKVTWQMIGLLRQAHKLDTDSYEVLYRLAAGYFWLADNTSDEDRDRDLGNKGYKLALKASKIEPKRVEGHYWAAMCIGEYSKGIGIITALAKGIEKKFLRHLKKALSINKNFYQGGGYNAYGCYHHELPWPKRDNDKALEYFRKSVKMNPRGARAHYYMAKVLADEDKKAEAQKHIKKCLSINPKSWEPPDNYRFQYFCKKLAKKL